jgi:uncharacterized membrane protein (UPF0127 family)
MAQRLMMTVLVFAMVVAFGCESQPADTEHVRLGQRDWTLELATDEASIRRGLMDRQDIPTGTGMLFVFKTQQVHQFWMANCLIDIDVLFIDGQGRIASMHRMKAESPRSPTESVSAYEQRMKMYSSRIPVRFAIELPAGSIDAMGVRAGESVSLDTDRLKSLAK